MKVVSRINSWNPTVYSKNCIQNPSDIYEVSTTIKGDPIKQKMRTVKMPVQPLFTGDDIDRLKEYFRNRKYAYKGLYRRDYTLTVLALATGRRAGDLVKLRYGDVVDQSGKIKDYMTIREGKTQKISTLIIHPNLKQELKKYIDSKSEINLQDYMFTNYKTGEPITTQGFYKVLQKAKVDLGIDLPFGTHSLRKTSGRLILSAASKQQYGSVMKMLSKDYYGHSSEAITNRYLCFTQEEMDHAMLAMEF